MITLPKGTKDVVPSEAYKWHFVENAAREVARLFGIDEIRTPTFEQTQLFLRGVGDTTDIVNKEMYTFEDKGGRSMTLKPEGTAGVARAFIENSLGALPQPTRMYYITPVFRYERPQSGRLREHHQFGVEFFGSASPAADAEVISVAKTLFDRLGIGKLTLNINSIGCPTCRKKYNEALKEYIGARFDDMCPTCRERFDKNPLRILDCKEEGCRRITADAPVILDFLCDDCRAHHERVCELLGAADIDFVINPHIVRGLDYYTRTVFEFVSDNLGAQGTVCGGGRYDNLIAEVGGKPTPAVGFGMGLERLILTLEALNLPCGLPYAPTVYVATMGGEAYAKATVLLARLRADGISAAGDLAERSLKAQLKYADKLGAEFVAVVGEDELASDTVNIKRMSDGVSCVVAFDEAVSYVKNAN